MLLSGLRSAPRGASVIALSILAVLAGACVGGDRFDVSPMDATIDRPDVPVVITETGTDAPVGRVCTSSAQCEDGIMCTRDFCNMDHRCVNEPSPAMCDDGLMCTGIETCDVRRGCVRGEGMSCNDNDPCTIDRCSETGKTCTHLPRDLDHDGDPDIHCMAAGCPDGGTTSPDGGTCWVGGDCDDNDPRVSSTLPEVCGDLIDNNCNGLIDAREATGCVRPPHDRCDDPLDVSAGGHFSIDNSGTTPDYRFSCAGGMAAHDAVLRFHLDTARDVAITAGSTSSFVYLAVQTRCGTIVAAETLGCNLGFPARYNAHSLAPGDYFAIVGSSGGGAGASPVDVDVSFTAPTPLPSNDRCTAPIVIPSSGGTFTGDLIGIADDVTTRCGGSQPDVVYSLTLTEPHDVTVRANGRMREGITISLVDACTRAPMTLRCASGSMPQFTAHEVPMGTYFVIVEGGSLPAYTLNVAVDAPTPPLPGDLCAMPLTAMINATTAGTLTGMESDYQLSCSGGSDPDVVYQFTLTERSDVQIVTTGATGGFFYVALQTTCGVRTSERSCTAGGPARVSARGLDPGTYFVIIRGTRAADFTLTINAGPPVVAMPVSGNDTCATAAPIAPGGGLFTGNTLMLRHDYTCPCVTSAPAEDAVFLYHLDTRRRVSFSLDGTMFDTVMWLTRNDGCPGTDVPAACNDDSIGLASAFDVVLDPGDYNLFVGGYSAGAHGPYSLTVTTSAP